MGIETYFPAAGDNNIGGALFPEGQARSSLNNGMRQVQADLRAWYNDPGWIQYGDGNGPATVTRISEASFSVAGADLTAAYHAGRRVKANGSSTGTIYGTITGSAFSTDTTVTVDWDDSGALASEAITVWIAALPAVSSQIPGAAAPGANILPNGQFIAWTAGTALVSLNDNTVTANHCFLLSDGNDIADISKETTVKPVGAPAALKAEVETGNKKFGFFFPIPNADSLMLVGGVASLSFKARVAGGNSTLDSIRAAIITWSGTADAYTADVVSAWNAVNVNPTLVANWTYENSPFTVTLDATAWKSYRIQNVAIDTASGANVGVFIWVNDTDATIDDLFYLADVKIEPGPVSTPILRAPAHATNTLTAIQMIDVNADNVDAFRIVNEAGIEVVRGRVSSGGHGVVNVRNAANSTKAVLSASINDRGSLTLNGFEVYPTSEVLGTAVIPPGGGATIAFPSIRFDARRITLMMNEISLSGTDDLELALGDSGGIETNDYGSLHQRLVAGTVTQTTGPSDAFLIGNGTSADGRYFGVIVLWLLDPLTNLWTMRSDLAQRADNVGSQFSVGSKALSGPLTQLRLQASGSNTFDNIGICNILVE